MSQRQLPPVRISFIADTTQFNKASDDVLKKVQKVADSATKIQSVSAGAASIKMATQTAVGLIQRQLAYAAQQLVSTVHTVAAPTAGINREMRTARDTLQTALASIIRRMVLNADRVRVSTRETNRVLREATDLILHYLLMNIRRMVVNVQNVRATGSASVNRTLRDAVDVVLHSLLRYIRLLVVNAHNVRVSTRQVNRAIRDAIDVAAHAIISSIRASFTAAATALQNRPLYVPMIRARLRQIIRDTLRSMLQTISISMQAGAANLAAAITPAINQFTNGLGRAVSRLINTARRNAVNALSSTSIGGAIGGGGGGGGGAGGGGRAGGEGFGSMGARADLYMHTVAIKNMAKYSSSVFDTYMKYQDLNVALEVFTGGATSAAKAMAEIQDYAIKSPYDTLALGDSARNMMAYGQSTEETLEIMKMMGDVAGGNTERFNLLMYAMSQITSLGKLQGNELRQLTEQGFNPLTYWAQKTQQANESMEDAMKRMYDAKKKGLVTSKMVIEALKAETSAGGRYHDMAKRLNETLRGLQNQVRETFVKLSNILLQYLEPSAKRFLKSVLEIQNRVLEFTKKTENFPFIAKLAHLAKNAFFAVAAFHAVGIVFSGLVWWGRSALTIISRLWSIAMFPLVVVSKVLRFGLLALNGALRILRITTMLCYTAVIVLRSAFLLAAGAARIMALVSLGVAAGFRIMGMAASSARAQLIVLQATVFLVNAVFRAMRTVTMSVYASLMLVRAGTFIAEMAFASLRITAILSALGMWSMQSAAIALRGAMILLRVASMLAWLAILGPVTLVVAGIGAVALGIWGIIQAVSGAGGLSGAFTSAWETVKWFWDSANGFIANFGENMGILTKYVNDNWKLLFSDLGKMALLVLQALPGNFAVSFRAGVRIINAFGRWLDAYMVQAFKSAYTKVGNFLSDFFSKMMQNQQAIFQFLTTPTMWMDTNAGKYIKALIADMKKDAGVATTEGIGAAVTQIMTEEMANLRTGLEGFKSSLPELSLNLKQAPLELPPGIAPDRTKPKPKPKAKEEGPATSPGVWRATEAMSADSGAYRKFIAEFSMRQQGVTPPSDPQVTEQRKGNKLLKDILDSHRNQSIQFRPARVGGVP